MTQGRRNKPGMSREEAARLYDTLKHSMESKFGKEGLNKLISEEKSKKAGAVSSPNTASHHAGIPAAHIPAMKSKISSGQRAALILIVLIAGAKLTLAGLELSGYSHVPYANAAMHQNFNAGQITAKPYYSSEEERVLKELDSRRVELEKRTQNIEQREDEIKRQGREFAARLTEMRELTQRLELEREKDQRKKDGQLEQLANVYGSMNPQEAAGLIEQLDVSIAKQLIERMPEKRIGQILAMMAPERALTITRMLSHLDDSE